MDSVSGGPAVMCSPARLVREESEANMTDDDLRRGVAAELRWDPRVDSAAIEVSAASGTVTLRGTVASLWHKRAGGDAAARVRGVRRHQ
jgi:osmotically-inducible protein OsmY